MKRLHSNSGVQTDCQEILTHTDNPATDLLRSIIDRTSLQIRERYPSILLDKLLSHTSNPTVGFCNRDTTFKPGQEHRNQDISLYHASMQQLLHCGYNVLRINSSGSPVGIKAPNLFDFSQVNLCFGQQLAVLSLIDNFIGAATGPIVFGFSYFCKHTLYLNNPFIYGSGITEYLYHSPKCIIISDPNQFRRLDSYSLQHILQKYWASEKLAKAGLSIQDLSPESLWSEITMFLTSRSSYLPSTAIFSIQTMAPSQCSPRFAANAAQLLNVF